MATSSTTVPKRVRKPRAKFPEPEPTFYPFRKLPLELRLKIWGEASFHPRTVDVWAKKTLPEHEYAFWNGRVTDCYTKFVSTSPIPAILHACAESRRVGLKHYELTFGTEDILQKGTVKLTSSPRIYVNFASDTICPRGNQFYLGSFEQFWSFKIRKVAIDLRPNCIANPHWFNDRDGSRLWAEKNLEEVIFYYSTHRLRAWHQLELCPLSAQSSKGKTFMTTFVADFNAFLDTLEEEETEKRSIVRRHCLVANVRAAKSFPFKDETWTRPAVRMLSIKPASEPIVKSAGTGLDLDE